MPMAYQYIFEGEKEMTDLGKNVNNHAWQRRARA